MIRFSVLKGSVPTDTDLAKPYTMVYYHLMLEITRTDEFDKWLKKLRDATARARINVRIRRIQLTGNLGDCKPVGDGVSELRIDYGPGYRVYFARRGEVVILLLIGGDKSTQQRDIKKAKELNEEYEWGEEDDGEDDS